MKLAFAVVCLLTIGLSARGDSPPPHDDKSPREGEHRRPRAERKPPNGPYPEPSEPTAHRPGEHASSFQYFSNRPGTRPAVCVGQVIYRNPGGTPACAVVTAAHCIVDGSRQNEFIATLSGRGVGKEPAKMKAYVPPEAHGPDSTMDVALLTGGEKECGEELAKGPVETLCPKNTEVPPESEGYSHRAKARVRNKLHAAETAEARKATKQNAAAIFDTDPGYMAGDSGTPFFKSTSPEGAKCAPGGKCVGRCLFGIFIAGDKSRGNSRVQPVPKSMASVMLPWLHETLAKVTGKSTEPSARGK